MRISTALLATLALVPATALADEDAQPHSGGYVAPQSVAYEGGSIPEGSTIEKKPNLVFVGTGVGIFGAAYTASVISAISLCGPGSTCDNGAGWLYLPLVGPFVAAASGNMSNGAKALAMFDGGIQILGAALAVTGFVAQKRFVVWQDKDSKTQLKVTPDAGAAPASDHNKAGFNAGVSVTLTHL